MKIVVLGSSSFYGNAFARYASDKAEVIGLYRPQFDITKDFDIPSADVIVNFVAEALVPESWVDPARWMHVNGTCLSKIIDKSRCKKFIHVSTPEVYGSTAFWLTE